MQNGTKMSLLRVAANDNECGNGYKKITTGRGMWDFGSFHFDGAYLKIAGETPPDDIAKVFNESKYDEIIKAADNYWGKENPNLFKKSEALKSLFKGINYLNFRLLE
jgi:hypothetical protein